MSRIRASRPARFAVVVDEEFEVVIPLPPARGQRIDAIFEPSAGAGGIGLISGPSGPPARATTPDGWRLIGTVHVSAGQALVTECNITEFGEERPRPPFVPGSPCAHVGAVPVFSIVDSEVLAALCVRCDVQLPAAWLTCRHGNAIATSALGERPGRFLCNDCGGSGWKLTAVDERMSA
jgi:hypothetical protein